MSKAEDNVFAQQSKVGVASLDLNRSYAALLVEELQTMVDDGEVEGVFVIVQRSDGKMYPHFAGRVDAVRALGVAQVVLHREGERQFGAWTSRSTDRRTLEEGF